MLDWKEKINAAYAKKYEDESERLNAEAEKSNAVREMQDIQRRVLSQIVIPAFREVETVLRHQEEEPVIRERKDSNGKLLSVTLHWGDEASNSGEGEVIRHTFRFTVTGRPQLDVEFARRGKELVPYGSVPVNMTRDWILQEVSTAVTRFIK